MSFGATALIWHHSKATGNDLLVAMSLANYISDEGAWPKVETIAAGARTSVRQAHRSLKKLAELGEITWQKGAGGGQGVYKTSRYFILLTCPETCSGDWNHSPKKEVRPDTVSPLVCQPVTSRPDTVSPLDMTATADKPVIEQVNERVKLTNTETDAEFEEFWEMYPRKQSKPAARKAFAKARKLADHQTILDAVFAYKLDVNREQAFTKMPATWLNNECWNDPPLPAKPKAQTRQDKIAEAEASFMNKITEQPKQITDWNFFE